METPPRFNHPPTSYEGRLERAVAIFKNPRGLAANKMKFLQAKGLSQSEILEALNIASNGELLRAAGLE